jgi:DNA segregation ATPase FtsK/SpoIIIE, S-DNA-T family
MMDFSGAHGHLAIVGAPRTGRSTALRTVMMAGMITHTPEEMQFCCIDFGGGTLHPYAGAPHVSAVAGRADTPLVRRILAELMALIVEREAAFRELNIDTIVEFRQRRAAGLLPPEMRAADMFLLIDNWGAVRAEFEDIDAAVAEIAARGLGAGVHLVLTAGRWAEFRAALRDSIGTRMELRLNDPAESEISRPLARRLPPSMPGRGIAAPGIFLQLVLPRLDGQESEDGLREAQEDVLQKIVAGWPEPGAPPVRILPTRVTRRALDQFAVDPALGVPIGLAEQDLAPVTLDLVREEQHLLVYGDSGSGRTEFLRSWMTGLMSQCEPSQLRFLLFDVRRTLLSAVPDEYLGGYAAGRDAAADYVANLVTRLRERMPPHDISQRDLLARNWWQGPEMYVVVDDYDLIGGPQSPLAPLAEFLAHARDVGLHVVLACRVSGASRMFGDGVVTRTKDLGSAGLILSGDPREGVIFGGERAQPRPPGRGVLIRRTQPKMLVQVAIAEEHDEFAASAGVSK